MGAAGALLQSPRAADLRLLPVAVACWGVCGWALTAPSRAIGTAAALSAVIALVAARVHRRRSARTALVVLVAASMCTVLVSAGVRLWQRGAGPLPQWVSERAVAQLTGRVAADPFRLKARDGAGFEAAPATQRYAVRVRLDRADARGRASLVSAHVLVMGGPQWAGAQVGSRVRLVGRLAASQSSGDVVVAVVQAFGPPETVEAARIWWRVAERVRQGLREAVDDRAPGPGGLLPSLVVGDTSRLPAQVVEDLRVSGLTHLTAVSGANVAIVTGSALWLAVALGLLRRARLIVAAAALAAFVVLARPEPSVVRAAGMGAVMLAGLLTSRGSRGVPALCTAVIVLLVVDPWLARSAGFALSVAATAALLLLAPAWAARLGTFMPRPLALALAAPAAAQAACGPLVILLQPQVSTVAVPANLLAEPAVLPATVLGVLAALLALLWPGGAELVAAAGCVATWWITQVAHRAAALPMAQVAWPEGVRGALLLAVATAAVVALTLSAGRPPGRFRFPSGRRLMAGSVAVLLAVSAGWWLAGRRAQSWAATDWAVVFCDVGQGDALLIRSGPDRAVMVDVGPEPADVRRCLDDAGVRGLDLMVLSHFHADHVAGLDGVLDGVGVGPVLAPRLRQPEDNAVDVERVVAAHPGSAGPLVFVDRARSGRFGAGGWVLDWRVPDPVEAVAADPGEPDGTAVNDASLTLLVELGTPNGGRLRVVALGDLELDGQSALTSRLTSVGGWIGDGVDVVKVAHHGSARQRGDLYRLLAPRVALIGVGADNDYGHPSASALDMLGAIGATVVRTDRGGHAAVAVLPERETGSAALEVRRGSPR